MDLFAAFHARTQAALLRLVERGILPGNLEPWRFVVEPSRGLRGYDLVTDAALVHGRAHQGGRVALAVDLARELDEDPDVARAVAAGAGLVGVILDDRLPASALAAALTLGEAFGRGAPGPPVIVAVGPPVPSGAGGFDRVRVAVVADALARLLAFAGHDVSFVREAGSAAVEADLRSLGVVGGSGPVGSGAAARVDVREAGHRAAPPVASDARDTIEVKPCRMIRTSADIRPASARLVDLLAAGEADALRFALLARRCGSTLDLDLAAMVDRSYGAPLFHVRYAYARARKVLRDASLALPDLDLSPAALAGADLTMLSDAGEVAIRRLVLRFPHTVALAASARAPHRVVDLLRDLAGAVHHQWNRSKDQPQLRFVNEEQRSFTEARLGLVTASTLVLKSGLAILGVSAPEEMR